MMDLRLRYFQATSIIDPCHCEWRSDEAISCSDEEIASGYRPRNDGKHLYHRRLFVHAEDFLHHLVDEIESVLEGFAVCVFIHEMF